MVERTSKAREKIEQVTKATRHQEPDRIPVFGTFWALFVERWREELGLPFDADPHQYYDLDFEWTSPNLDPAIRPFEILKQDEGETIVRTGFGAVVRKVRDAPMPHYYAFDTDTIEKVRSFEFEDPGDERRFFSRGDDHLNGVGSGPIARNLDPWIERVREAASDFAVMGDAIEANEFMTRCIGQENALLWIAMYPDEIARFAEQINEYMVDIIKAQIKAADGQLDLILIGGDVAYTGGMLFSPDYWRKYFKPGLKAMIQAAHDGGLPVLMHACGDNRLILDDYAEIGVDAWHPVEFKAGQDVLDLRRKMGHRLGFVGNNDVRLWAEGNLEEIERHTLQRLNVAKGGGYVFSADHSVPPQVSPATYEHVLGLVRQYGNYPLQLGEHDIPDIT